MASVGGGNTAVDKRVDGFVPTNAPISEVPQQSHTWMDLGRPISSALPAAHTVVPGGTVGPQRNMGNREGAGFNGRYFCVKTSGANRVSVHSSFVRHYHTHCFINVGASVGVRESIFSRLARRDGRTNRESVSPSRDICKPEPGSSGGEASDRLRRTGGARRAPQRASRRLRRDENSVRVRKHRITEVRDVSR